MTNPIWATMAIVFALLFAAPMSAQGPLPAPCPEGFINWPLCNVPLTPPPPPPPAWWWCGYCGCQWDECLFECEYFGNLEYGECEDYCDGSFQREEECDCSTSLEYGPAPAPAWLQSPEGQHAALQYGMGQAMGWRPFIESFKGKVRPLRLELEVIMSVAGD